jgi:hypothetical protein
MSMGILILDMAAADRGKTDRTDLMEELGFSEWRGLVDSQVTGGSGVGGGAVACMYEYK